MQDCEVAPRRGRISGVSEGCEITPRRSGRENKCDLGLLGLEYCFWEGEIALREREN